MDYKSIISTIALVLKKHTAIDLSKKIDIKNNIPAIEAITYPIIGVLIGLILFSISLLKYLYSPIFIGFILFIAYFSITKGKNFHVFITSIYNHINKKTNTLTENYIKFEYINIFTAIGYFCLFAVSKSSALLLAPIFAYLLPATLPLMLKSQVSSDSTIAAYAKNKVFSYAAFILSFTLPILINTKLAIAVAIIYVLMIYLIKYFNKNYETAPEHFESILIEGVFVIFLIISYLLFL